MEVVDYGIVISSILSCENGYVVVLFSQQHGKVSGYLKNNGITIPQIGDFCYFRIKRRLDIQLGQIHIELIQSVNHAFRLADRTSLLAIRSICEIIDMYIYCEDKYEDLYFSTLNCIENISDLKMYALWELMLLKSLGYGIDVSKCCVTNERSGLTYLSPKTGKAVIQKVGERYKNKLFKIPSFWLGECCAVLSDIIASLKITGYFLGKLNEHIGVENTSASRVMLSEWLERIKS